MAFTVPPVPVISPPPPGPQPFWSVMIPTYNRLTHLEKAIRSALEQDPGPDQMQIQVVDNCSDKADMEKFVRDIAGDRIIFSRNEQNLGTYANFNSCINRARGQWVHVLHDDDIVNPGFYEQLASGVRDRADVGMAFCRHAFIDDSDKQTFTMWAEQETPGVLDNWIERIATCQRIQFSVAVVRRSVYEALGGFFPEDQEIASDWEMWMRIASRYAVWYEPRILALYRQHGAAGSAGHTRSGFQTRDCRNAIEVAKAYLPPDRAAFLAARGQDHYAASALQTAAQLLQQGHIAFAMNHLREALLISQSPLVARALDSGVWRQFQRFAGAVTQHVNQYNAGPGINVTSATVRAIRRHIAQQWVDLSVEYIEDFYGNELGKLHALVLSTGLRDQPMSDEDKQHLEEIIGGKDDLLADPRDLGRLVAALLYRRGAELPVKAEGRRVPEWLAAALRA